MKSAIRGRTESTNQLTASHETGCLDPVQLGCLENAFQEWVQASSRQDIRLARMRVLLIFLIIRYAGARLNEALELQPLKDIDTDHGVVHLGATRKPPRNRKVPLPDPAVVRIRSLLDDLEFRNAVIPGCRVDPGHIRRKFYEQALSCGLLPSLSAPDLIRKARGVELMREQVPLPVVQRILGHSTPNLAASYVRFSDDDMNRLAEHCIARESRRKTSARNMFFGKIDTVQKGDIQSMVQVMTISGVVITSVVTNESLDRLEIQPGRWITAEVKAPWVILQKSDQEPGCTAENRLSGPVIRIREGEVTIEYTIQLPDGTWLCALASREAGDRLQIGRMEMVWAVFTAHAVVLHVD